MRRKTGNKQKYGGKSIRPCDRKAMKQRDIRKQMSKGKVNFTTIQNTFQRKIWENYAIRQIRLRQNKK